MKAILTLILLTASSLLAADVAAGKKAYDQYCKRCHGADGAPNAAIAKMMKVEMHHLGDKVVQDKSDKELLKESIEGVGKMKAIPAAAKDGENIVAFLRTLKK